ncbi:MAG: hypothetical protein ABI556_14565 [Gemmatimonadales bacterium]
MQATTVQPVTAPVAPAAPGAAPTVTFTDVDGTTQTLVVPMSQQAVNDLKSRRSQLSEQLTSAVGRRNRISDQIRSAPDGASRTGLEQRLVVLDKRIVQLETDIASSGRQLAAVPTSLVGDDWNPGRNVGDVPRNVTTLGGMGIMFIAFPLAITLARNLWKRGSRKAAVVQQQLTPVVEQRLERVEQGVDAIAIEIERIAEGQRFVTRLLSETPAGLKLQQGEPIREKVPT